MTEHLDNAEAFQREKRNEPPESQSRDVFDFLSAPLPSGTTVLEASAGTGKTYSIAHVALRLIAERDFDISELLIVTFTDAAAAELRERVRMRLRAGLDSLQGQSGADPTLRKWAEQAHAKGSAQTYRQRLDRALTRFDAASISTIHGFCQRVLTQYAFESGADFGLQLDTNGERLIDEHVSDFLGTELTKVRSQEYRRVLAHGLPVRAENLVKLAAAHQRNPHARILGGGAESGEDAEALRTQLRGSLPNLLSEFRAELKAHGSAFLVQAERDAEDALRLLGQWDTGPLRWTPLRKLFRSALLAGGKARSHVDAVNAVADHALPRALEQLYNAEHPSASRWAEQLHRRLLESMSGAFARHKSRRGLMTFDDLIGFVSTGLERSPALVSALRAQFRGALIDEFQDTDELQWQIFRRIFQAAGRPLFLIGDPKQAIYSFRGADLDVYLRARKSADQQAELGCNYRSDRGLVEAVGRLFSLSERPFHHPDLKYPSVAADAEVPRIRIPGEPALRPLRLYVLGKKRDSRGSPPRPKFQKEEQWVARDVLGFLQSGAEIQQGDTFRPVTPGDCAVLVRTNRQAAAVQGYLRDVGVPSVLRSDSSVFDTDEAGDIALWLRAIARPTDGYALRAFLSTRLSGVTAREVERTLESEAHHERWVGKVARWADQFEAHGVMRALRQASTDLAFEERWASEKDGERRLANVWHLAELLHAEGVAKQLGPASLVRFLQAQTQSANTADESRQVRLETDANAVEIATIHKSKGLEYPAVWCACLSQNPFDSNWPYLGSRDGERVLGLVDSEQAREDARHQEFQQQLRLAYVALTRAKHLCCVPWKPPYGPSSGRSPLDWLIFGSESRSQVLSQVGKEITSAARSPARLDDYCAMLRDRFNCPHIDVLGDGFEPKRSAFLRARPDLQLQEAEYKREERIDSLWRWTSFTAITRPADDSELGTALAGHDEAVGDPFADSVRAERVQQAPGSPLSSDPSAHFAGFRGGTQLGNLLHGVLEVADFSSKASVFEEVDQRMHRYGLATLGASDPLAPDAAAITDVLWENLHTQLHSDEDGFCLSALPREDRIAEMPFSLPLANNVAADSRISPRRLADVFRRHPRKSLPASYADRLGRLRFTPLRGMLQGSLDLVFRQGGRYFVADYKSNWLGDARTDYAPLRLVEEMSVDHYHLQSQLYMLALHRFLSGRLPGYDPSAHLGGSFYLFLRGMAQETGPHFGVHWDRTPVEAILDLESTLFDSPSASGDAS